MLIFPSMQGEGVWNNIHLLITGKKGDYGLRITCAAWKDVEEPGHPSRRTRLWIHSDPLEEKEWHVSPVSIATVEEDVRHRLWKVFDRVSEWNISKLTLSSEIP